MANPSATTSSILASVLLSSDVKVPHHDVGGHLAALFSADLRKHVCQEPLPYHSLLCGGQERRVDDHKSMNGQRGATADGDVSSEGPGTAENPPVSPDTWFLFAGRLLLPSVCQVPLSESPDVPRRAQSRCHCCPTWGVDPVPSQPICWGGQPLDDIVGNIGVSVLDHLQTIGTIAAGVS